MLHGLGLEASPRGIARLYRGLVDIFVLDRRDAVHAPEVAALGMWPVVTETLMRTPAHAARLAAVVLRALDTRARGRPT
jgi:LPPG:FO 2-phospho-L-lactate transferase